MKRLHLLWPLLCASATLLAQETAKSGAAKWNYNGNEDYPVYIQPSSMINTDKLEFSPAFHENGIVYVTTPDDTTTTTTSNKEEPFFELYFAETNPQGLPMEPYYFSAHINSPLHEGPVAFNPSGNRIYFTRNSYLNGKIEAGKENTVRLKIFEGEKSPSDWINIKPLSFNSDDFNSMHPTLSADGNWLYFSSDREGGFGGFDLYAVQKLGDGWSEPKNLGAQINSDKDEAFPFMHASGKLFFASKGHQGRGGFDIFMADVEGNRGGTVTQLGVPFNSTVDDLGFILNQAGTAGFYTSSRGGGAGQDDIYYFEAPNGIEGVDVNQVVATVYVYDAVTAKPIEGASIWKFKQSEDGLAENSDLYNIRLAKDSSGAMGFELIRRSEAELGAPDAITALAGIASVPLWVQQAYLLLVAKPGYETKEVFIPAQEEGVVRIEVALQPNDCVPLDGQVLIKGTNQPVSNALVRIHSDDCASADIVVETNLNGSFTACLPRSCNYTLTASLNESTGSTTLSTQHITTNRLSTVIYLDKADSPLTAGTVFVLDKIFYDFDKSYIRKGAARDLDALIALMKQYPNMEVELSAHTDSRGDDEYNMQLSLRRADAAKAYLTARNIAPNRITTAGFGESQLRNRCQNGVACSELEHQYNRRTEIKIINVGESIQVEYTPNQPEVVR